VGFVLESLIQKCDTFIERFNRDYRCTQSKIHTRFVAYVGSDVEHKATRVDKLGVKFKAASCSLSVAFFAPGELFANDMPRDAITTHVIKKSSEEDSETGFEIHNFSPAILNDCE
jgi:hypothetical protein